MGKLNDKLGRPILEDGADPYYMRHVIGSNYVASLHPRLRADRSASYTQTMLMIDILLHKYEASYVPSDNDPNLLCMPNLFNEPDQGTKLKNKQTGEVYTITDTIKNPQTNMWEGLIRISSITPPDPDAAEKLEFFDDKARVRFTAEYSKSLDTESQTVDEIQDDAGPIRPTVVYALLRKEPGTINAQPFGPRKQYKPRHMENLKPDVRSTGRTIQVSAHCFDLLVEFACFTTDNRSCDLLTDWFEEFMRQYTWVLELNGVQRILYWKRGRDAAVTKWRQDLISRTVQYFFRIEEILPTVRKGINTIDIKINLEEAINDESERWYGLYHVSGQLTESEYRRLFVDHSGKYLFGDLILNDNNLFNGE